MAAIAKIARNRKIYECKECDYTTCNKNDFGKHLHTKKHKECGLAIQNGDLAVNSSQKSQHICQNCGKNYKDNSGLWKHKNKGVCINEVVSDKNTELSNDVINSELIMLIKELVKGQYGLQESIMELCKNSNNSNIINATNNNNTINSHNKAFNLQFFLNETCKDAMNINEFIDSIQLQLSDLEKMEEIGFVEGISNIIIRNLNALDVSKRPLHCTDKKRETIYIKDQGVWEKDVENTKIRGLVKKVAGKNSRLLQVFKEKHPDYNQYHSKYSTQYNKLIIEAFGGKGDNDLEKEDKIIRNITKNILVEK